tara:strand:- start:154 stop:330 length:177 start_codon:yes stop_codon:yes gene_type:complete
LPANAPPSPEGSTFPTPSIGSPASCNSEANSLKVILRAESVFDWKFPSFNSSVDASTS